MIELVLKSQNLSQVGYQKEFKMEILSIIMKSGIKISMKGFEDMKIITREETKLSYMGTPSGEETKWEPIPTKEVVTYLRVAKDGSLWEFKESEIAAFEFKNQDEAAKGDISI